MEKNHGAKNHGAKNHGEKSWRKIMERKIMERKIMERKIMDTVSSRHNLHKRQHGWCRKDPTAEEAPAEYKTTATTMVLDPATTRKVQNLETLTHTKPSRCRCSGLRKVDMTFLWRHVLHRSWNFSQPAATWTWVSHQVCGFASPNVALQRHQIRVLALATCATLDSERKGTLARGAVDVRWSRGTMINCTKEAGSLALLLGELRRRHAVALARRQATH